MKAILSGFICGALIVLAFGAKAQTSTLQFQFVAPTERLDGTPLAVSEIDRFELWTVAEDFQEAVKIADIAGDNQDYLLNSYDLTSGSCFVLYAVDTQGVSGPPSEEACVLAQPGEPINFRLIVTQ